MSGNDILGVSGFIPCRSCLRTCLGQRHRSATPILTERRVLQAVVTRILRHQKRDLLFTDDFA